MRRFGLGLVAGAAFVLGTGLWSPATAAVTDFGIDSPGEGDATSSRVVNVGVHAESDSSQGLQYMRLELSGPSFTQRLVWCAPGPISSSCPSWSSGQQTSPYRGTFAWDTSSLTRFNGEYTLILTVREHGAAPLTQTRSVLVNTQPQVPQWISTAASTSGGRPVVTLKWQQNPEPDVTQYKITRTSSNGGPSRVFQIPAGNPGAQGCSQSGGTYSCTDSTFTQTGYAGTYTYFISATRSSPVSSAGVSSPQSSRATAISEPRSGGGGGSGGGGTSTGGGGGTSTGGGGTNPGGSGTNPGGFISNGNVPFPSLTPTPDPDAVDPREFYSGTFEKALPYKPVTRVEQLKLSRQASGFSEELYESVNPRKMLVPVAGGLFTILAAMHFRRMLRDSQ